ncbi:MAG: hypothetical protein OEY00_07215 [Gammaproteobacteria bacterium]|nr:hypothetical protein [Gammaproteobacteria bacterium]
MNFVVGKLKILILCLVVVITACGGSGDDTVSTLLVGVASKGPMKSARVEVFPLTDAGEKGERFANTSTTDTNGRFSVDIGSYTGNVLLEVSGGQYIDEASNSDVSNTVVFHAVISAEPGTVNVNVTPLSDIALQWAYAQGGLTTSNINSGNALVSSVFGIDIHLTEPADVLSNEASQQGQDEQAYGLALAGISQFAADYVASGSVETVMYVIANDLNDNNRLDTFDLTYLAAVNSFIASEHNQASAQSAVALISAINANANNNSPVASSFTRNLVGDWYLIEFDDFIRGDGSLDDYPDEVNMPVNIQINEDGSWTWTDDLGVIDFPANRISLNESALTATITFDDNALARMILTFDGVNNSIHGRVDLLSDDGFTYHENYETWIMAAAKPCSTTGSPNSFTGFISSTDDCGNRIAFVEADLVGKEFIFNGDENKKYSFSGSGFGTLTVNNVTVSGFSWSVDRKGYLEIGVSSLPIRMLLANMEPAQIIGPDVYQVRVFTEDESLYPSDLIFDAKEDGAISEVSMTLAGGGN